jgi:RNA polymerase sigma factor (sigma-70 family)
MNNSGRPSRSPPVIPPPSIRGHLHHPLPAILERLLRAEDGPTLDRTWSEFVEEYGRLILHVARAQGGQYDDIMDRYAYVLEQLRQDDFRRLRKYVSDGRGKFTTWLVVVIRRLCVDEVRSRYGRQRGEAEEAQRQRRDLADLVGAEVDVDLLAGAGASPDEALRAKELSERLAGAIAELEASDRLVLRLRFEDDAPVSEIARALSLPSVFHVYRSLNRIYDQLRSALGETGVRDAAP